MAELGNRTSFNCRKFFNNKGNPLAPVPPNIELMMNILSEEVNKGIDIAINKIANEF